jgi:signal-transduction protein with cAMP-binding, CBS, and nucleotidyltransferase domain
MRSQTVIFTRLVRDAMRPAPPTIAEGTSCGELVRIVADAAASSAIVVDGARRVRGIVTERDITRRIAFRAAPETPAERVMTAPVQTIEDGDYLYHAIARMRRGGLRHMPVVNAAGALVGVLNLHDALSDASAQLMDQIDRLTHEGTLDGLQAIKAAQVSLADELFADDVPAPDVQALLTHINNDIHRRIIEAELAAMAAEGWGEPPVPFAAIVMGSGGRGENYLYPDQDNGFILADYPDVRHGAIDPYFLELAGRLTRLLDSVGFPLCRGNVMATNPVWRKTLPQWFAQVRGWTRRRGNIALRLCDIFFDFRPVFGDAAMADELRGFVARIVQDNFMFLHDMYREEADHDVALGLFGRLVTERQDEDHKGEVNLKYAGTIPLVESVRLLSLRHGITATATLARIEALHRTGHVDHNEQDYLAGAFRHITGLLLRQQIADFKAGRKVGNFIVPELLSRREKDMLVDSFKAIREFRGKVKAEFTAELF